MYCLALVICRQLAICFPPTALDGRIFRGKYLNYTRHSRCLGSHVAESPVDCWTNYRWRVHHVSLGLCSKILNSKDQVYRNIIYCSTYSRYFKINIFNILHVDVPIRCVSPLPLTLFVFGRHRARVPIQDLKTSMMEARPAIVWVPTYQISVNPGTQTIVYWLVVWNIFYFPIYWECHHPNWRSYFSEGFKPPTSLSTTKCSFFKYHNEYQFIKPRISKPWLINCGTSPK